MFSEISKEIKDRMLFLEEIDKKDRADGTELLKRLRQINKETGEFLAVLAANCPQGEFIEIGTSAGFSSLWISLALKNRKEKLKTFEILPEKIKLAKETFKLCKVTDKIELTEGDFLKEYQKIGGIAFCFLDCEKHFYEPCYDIISERMVSGGLLVADNATNHYEAIKGMINKAQKDRRFDCVTVPIGQGEFICRKK